MTASAEDIMNSAEAFAKGGDEIIAVK